VFEVIIPLRNPSSVLLQTIESLVSQSDRTFRVLLSDNHSTDGCDLIDSAVTILRNANVPVELIRPERPLGRVEHWNWIHYQSRSEWLKPIFSGDSLKRDYFRTVRLAIEEHSQCKFIYSAYELVQGDTTEIVVPRLTGRYYSPDEVQDSVLRYGMQFGPPSAVSYHQSIFIAAGAYNPAIPICADSFLFCLLGARHGGVGLEEPLVRFQIHAARFSHSLPGKRKELFKETLFYILGLGGVARLERWKFPIVGYLRFVLRVLRTGGRFGT
jgi:glycosyltransferase involved in cell wall biosynthesis